MGLKGIIQEAVRSFGYEVRRVPKQWTHPQASPPPEKRPPGNGSRLQPPRPEILRLTDAISNLRAASTGACDASSRAAAIATATVSTIRTRCFTSGRV